MTDPENTAVEARRGRMGPYVRSMLRSAKLCTKIEFQQNADGASPRIHTICAAEIEEALAVHSLIAARSLVGAN